MGDIDVVFKKEVDMYPVIKEYLKRLHFQVIIDKPQGSGVKFQSLKGWTIDVVGVKKERGTEVIAVEVKNSLNSGVILDALSKAEMYRNVCTKSYIAFPKGMLRQKENRTTRRDIRQECERRGIGLLEVGEECNVIVRPVPSSLNVDKMIELMNEFEKNATKFSGFEEEDFVRYFLEEGVALHRFKLFAKEVEERLRPKRLVLTHEPRGKKWWYSFSRKLPGKKQYFEVPHFTVSFWDGVGIMTEFITREGPYLNNLRRNIRQDPEPFIKMLGRLVEIPCEIKVMDRVHTGGYSTESVTEYVIRSKYLDKDSIERLMKLIMNRERKGRMWLWIGYLFHLSNEETQSKELVDRVEKFIDGLMELYDFINKR